MFFSANIFNIFVIAFLLRNLILMPLIKPDHYIASHNFKSIVKLQYHVLQSSIFGKYSTVDNSLITLDMKLITIQT